MFSTATTRERSARGTLTFAPALSLLLALVGLVTPAFAAPPPSGEAPRPKLLSPWQSSKATLFASLATDLGIIYARPRLTLGYGAPFWHFVGLDTYVMTTNSFASAYVGWRASLPFLDALMGVRRVYPYDRRFMAPAGSHDGDDIDLGTGDERSVYNAVDFELVGLAPALHGAFFLSLHPVWIDAPTDRHVYEEVLRAVIVPPFALGLRGGYVFGLGESQDVKAGIMLEYVVTPGRSSNTVRAGPVALVTFSQYWEGLAAFSPVFAGPDQLGVVHGAYAFLGLLHRWAQRF